MRSLRARLLLATVLVAAVAVLATALLSRRVVTTELSRFVGVGAPVALAPIADALTSHLLAAGTLAGADSVLMQQARAIRRALILVGPEGRVTATSQPRLRDARIDFGPEGRMRLTGAPGTDAAGMVLELIAPPQADIPFPDSDRHSHLVLLPESDRGLGNPRPMLQRVDRGLWLAALIAIAIGALLMGVLSARMTGPIAALTDAARRMQSGDLSPRVPPRGDDEIATLTRGFNAMADALERSTALRRQMTHDVAHELRAPLTNLRAQIEAIQDGLLAPDPQAMVSLHEEVTLLARLIDDLQQLAAAESGALRIEPVAASVADALAGAAAGFRARATEHGVTLGVDAPDGLTVHADPVRLGQILRNLLDNAFAHTGAGGRVRLAARRDGDHIRFEVEDSGSGIAPEHLPHIFERLYRADPSRSRATGGAGLGLAIVRQLVEIQGGTVGAASEPGRGTCISFALPAA
jgi:two-component system sensor histidine kinase BaeS